MEKHSISGAGLPESDPEWKTWEEAQRALGRHEGYDEEGQSENDPSVWMMGRHAPQHEKYQNQSFNSDEPQDRDTEEEWHGPVMCHNCACYNANGEGNPDHAEKYEAGMAHIYPNRPVLACPDDPECHESGTCGICGDQINDYGMHGPDGHRMAILGDSAGGGLYRVAGAVSRASDTVWR